MSAPDDQQLEDFVQSVMRNLTKNGFPERKVAFPIERMYESADKKGLSFNTVLDVLAARGVAHEKTPEKIIFSVPAPQPASPFPGIDPSMFKGLDPSMLGGLDPSQFAGMSPQQMMQAAAQAMHNLPPEQIQAIQGMLDGMSDEQRAMMIEAAKKLGLG